MNHLALRSTIPLLAVFAAALPAQDPPVPPGRFGVQTILNRPIAWSDGYKTLLDIYLPNAAAPRTGWPCVLVCHGGGGKRSIPENVQQGREFAGFGYAVLAYDIRGEGVTRRLNPSGDTSEEARLRDMAEVFSVAAALLPGKIDVRRVAVTGRSMGGSHAYRAAAWSGRPLPKPGPIVKTFPRVSAVAGDWQALLRPEDLVPGGSLLQAKIAESSYARRSTQAALWARVRAHDYAAVRAVFANDPFKNYLGAITTNRVPVLGIMGHRDKHHALWGLTKAMPALRAAGVPHRIYFATRGHGLPDNRTEWLLHLDLKRRWWDRYLKGIRNGVDQEPVVDAGVIPADPRAHANPATHWRHVLAHQWPPAIPATTYYLAPGRKLQVRAPSSPAQTAPIRNRVAPGYDVEAFAKDTRTPSVLARIPLSRVTHQGPALAGARTLLGRPVFTADVRTTAGHVQLTAALYDIPPGGKPVYVTMGAVGLGRVAAGVHRVRIELDDVAYTFGAGHRIGLALQNLAIRDIPGNRPPQQIFYTPEFQDFDVSARMGGAFPARIELSLDDPAVSLLPRVADVSYGAGLAHRMALESHRAGAPYYVFFGGSGIGAGLTLPPYIPLEVDAWTTLGAQLFGTPYLAGFAGATDANGDATMTFRWPASLRRHFAGRRFTFAPLLIARGRLWSGSPAELRIRP